jgi:curved DNA-binding protein CbpA
LSSHHKILGIPTTATKLQIKRAYYKKSKLLHPDVNKSPNAAKDFARLNEAYEALTNPNYRIPKVTFRTRKQKSKEQLRREALKRRQDAARKRAEDIAKKYRNRNGHLKPKDLMKKDFRKIGQFLVGLLSMALIFFGIPMLAFETGLENRFATFLNMMLGVSIFGIVITAPAWIGIIMFYLFPEEK